MRFPFLNKVIVLYRIFNCISSRAMKNFTVTLSLENNKSGLEKVWNSVHKKVYEPWSVSYGSQSFPQHSYSGYVQVHNYLALLHDSNSKVFVTFWPRVYLFHLIDVPWILHDCNVIPQIHSLCFQIFYSTNFTNGTRVKWLPNCCCVCLIDFWLLVKLKYNKIKL